MANAGKPKPFTVYVAGRMSGLPNYGFHHFHRASRRLRELGIVVMSPAETAGCVQHMPREWYFRFDFAVISNVDAVVVLRGWQKSTGAKAEVVYATEVGIPVYEYSETFGIGSRVRIKGWDVDYALEVPDFDWREKVIPGSSRAPIEAFPDDTKSVEDEAWSLDESAA